VSHLDLPPPAPSLRPGDSVLELYLERGVTARLDLFDRPRALAWVGRLVAACPAEVQWALRVQAERFLAGRPHDADILAAIVAACSPLE
jgi:hypothetical protein